MAKAKPNKKRANPISMYFPEMESIKHSPRFQVIAANGILELLVNTLVEKKCKNERARNFNYGVKLVLLNEMGIISDKHFKLYDAFRNIRNEAAHGEFQLSPKLLEPFIDMRMGTVMEDPNKPVNFQDPKMFQLLCNLLFIRLWEDNLDVFQKKFDRVQPW